MARAVVDTTVLFAGAYRRDTNHEYLYALDDDFDSVDGVTRLATAHNPFEP